MFKQFLLSIILLVLLAGSVAIISAQDDLIQMAQWADEAEASSQYGEDSWSADQATGRPDVRACEDNVEAWASASTSGEEFLTLEFDDEVIPTQVNIYQTLAPGAIVGIAIIPDDNDEDPILFNLSDPSDECPSILSVNLPDDLPESRELTIFFDMSIVGNWNEIDAVELVGLVEGDEDDEDESSLEDGRYDDEFEIFEVDARPSSGGKGESNNVNNNSGGDYRGAWGRDVSCREGGSIENGVELAIIQQRAGNQYTITAIGIDGFDPVLGVMLSGDYGNALCSDDDGEAATYSANLPTTGNVDTASSSSQVIFNLNSGNAFEDVSIVVGGFAGSSGEFVLIIEGMFASSADGIGDPMSLEISPALYESGVDPTAYMISVVSAFDPLMLLVNSEYEQLTDRDSNPIRCDDAGSGSCWGDSDDLNNFYVSRSLNRQLGGGRFDAMISFPLQEEFVGGFINYIYTSFNSTEGDYVVAYHLGVEAQD